MNPCGLCHQPSDRPRYLVGHGTRDFHRECEEAMSAMGYEILAEDRRKSERRAAALCAGTEADPVSAQSVPGDSYPERGRGALQAR